MRSQMFVRRRKTITQRFILVGAMFVIELYTHDKEKITEKRTSPWRTAINEDNGSVDHDCRVDPKGTKLNLATGKHLFRVWS